RGGNEPDHAGDQEWLATEEVSELAGDWHDDRRGHEIAGDQPGVAIETVQLGDDARQRRADDRLVERREQQRQHHAGGRQDFDPGGRLSLWQGFFPSAPLTAWIRRRQMWRSWMSSASLNAWVEPGCSGALSVSHALPTLCAR